MKTHRTALHPAGFTLVELLVAMAVLALILVFVAQLMNSATQTTTARQKRMDADSQARTIFDKMAVDFSRMLRRADVDYLAKGTAAPNSAAGAMTGNDFLAFYTAADGYYGTASAPPARNARNPVSLVGYFVATDAQNRSQFVRLSKGLGWEAKGSNWQDLAYLPVTVSLKWPSLFNRDASQLSGMADPDFQTIGDSVVRFEYTYLLKPAAAGSGPALSISPYATDAALNHTSVDFHRDVAAIAVTLAIIDPTSRVIVSDYSKLTSESLFPDAAAGTTPDEGWIAKINSPAFATSASIPVGAASAVRVYQRYFYLDPDKL